jgi:uncharacterized protein DUF5666
MNIRVPTHMALILVSAATALFLAGCDDDDDITTNPAPIATPTPAPAATPTPAPAATPTPEPDNARTSFLGRIKSISPPALRAGGIDVMTDHNTIFERNGARITINELQVDEVVRVRGIHQGGGFVLAEKITVVEDTGVPE